MILLGFTLGLFEIIFFSGFFLLLLVFRLTDKVAKVQNGMS